jgi:hypothetical protein
LLSPVASWKGTSLDLPLERGEDASDLGTPVVRVRLDAWRETRLERVIVKAVSTARGLSEHQVRLTRFVHAIIPNLVPRRLDDVRMGHDPEVVSNSALGDDVVRTTPQEDSHSNEWIRIESRGIGILVRVDLIPDDA